MPILPQKRAILLVEDDHFVRETTSDLLSMTGATIFTAKSGSEAIGFLSHPSAPPIDLVVTDLAMPDGDGHWLLAQIRASPSLAGLRVIMMSAHVQAEKIEAEINAGADEYLVKPFDPEKFLAKVGQHLATLAAKGPARAK
jgi:CheY-like chemotaxis protein